jgi:enterochelin esterase-like enzyme
MLNNDTRYARLVVNAEHRLPFVTMRATRRSFLGALAATVATRIANADVATAADIEVHDLALPGDRTLGQRMSLVVPRKIAPTKSAPLLVLLHGLGETGDQRMGAFAWLERYGLESTLERLGHLPITRTTKRGDFTDEHLRAVNADLVAAPFAGFVIACPYTPNVNRAPNVNVALDAYTQWITDVVIPHARRRASITDDPARIAIDGCSLGGFVAIEVFLRSPRTFGALGTVQAAIGTHRAAPYAERLAAVIKQHGPRAIHIETSSADPFRAANEALSVELSKRHIPHDAIVLPGPHDQPWLREVGTLEMLRWHDRRFLRTIGKP